MWAVPLKSRIMPDMVASTGKRNGRSSVERATDRGVAAGDVSRSSEDAMSEGRAIYRRICARVQYCRVDEKRMRSRELSA
eukprot:3596603-Prymnesium_polylepis.2